MGLLNRVVVVTWTAMRASEISINGVNCTTALDVVGGDPINQVLC